MRKKLQSTKSLKKVGIAFLVLFVLLFFSRGYFPDTNDDGWSDPPIIDYLLLMGIGVCTAFMGVLFAFNSWTLDAEHYTTWYAQSLPTRPFKL